MSNQEEWGSKSISLLNWKVHLTVDSDGHLGIFVKHRDGSEVIDCEADIGDKKEFAVRLTTSVLEWANHRS